MRAQEVSFAKLRTVVVALDVLAQELPFTNVSECARLRLIWTDPHALDPSKISAQVTREVAGCVFHGYVAIESMNMWPRIPRACGHRFHGMWPPL